MRSFVTALALALIVLGVSATAEARAVHYRSQHPLPRKIGHGFCYINVPHVHDFGPSDPRLYREVNGEYYFVGDPAPFEYDGPRYSFYGPHPVVDADVQFGQPVYCYLNGPHFHAYQPPPQAQFEFKGGAYWYVGNYDPVYYQDRPRYVTVNAAYQPIAYTRPVVDVTVAPPSFHGEIYAGPGGTRGAAVVGAPVVSAGVTIGMPPPPPVQVGIGINIGGGGPPPPPVIVEERREVYEIHERHEHHDNGRHNGWYKHENEHEEHGWREPPHQEHGGGWRPAPAPPPPGWRGGASPPPQQGGGWRPAPAAPPQHHEKHGEPHGNGWHR